MLPIIRIVCCIAICMINVIAFISAAEAKWKTPQPFERLKAKVKGLVRKPPRGLLAVKAKASHKPVFKSVSSVDQPRVQHITKTPLVPVSDHNLALELPEEVLSAELTDDATPLEGVAYGLFGAKYLFGGNDSSGIDCSAFVKKVYQILKITIPRTAREQFAVGMEIPHNEIRKGDLVFFQTYAKYASHVGIYLGGNRMIHASSGSHRVTISKMDTPYFRSRYLGARRLQEEGGEAYPLLLAGLR
ncbi:MAG TPA: C40 family peptidase [Desulfuromonadaceae bacterium]|jgi:cell wall-associated NlpC family hydrolase